MNNSASGLTTDKVQEFKAAFHIFSKDQDNTITLKELKLVLDHLGFSIPENEVDMIFAENDPGDQKSISYEIFLKMMAKKLASNDTMEIIINGFKFLDKENFGYITVKEFRYFMAAFGEKFSIDEIQEMIAEADPEETGKIKYLDFSNKLFGKGEDGFGAEKKDTKKASKTTKK